MAEPASVTVREAVPADAQAIADVDHASHLAAYAPIFGAGYEPRVSLEQSLLHWQSILNGDQPRGPHWELVACIDDRIAAYARLTPSRDADASPGTVGEVGALYVHPDWWRRGVGQVLLDASLALLRERGYAVGTLWALEDNVRARAFYEAQGWHDDGGRQQLELDLPGVNLTEVRYRKVIAT
jgi:GNAT superfamily N-acetyltransferase